VWGRALREVGFSVTTQWLECCSRIWIFWRFVVLFCVFKIFWFENL